MNVLSRRHLLKAGAALAAGSIAFPLASRARALPAPKNVVIVLARGGWDPTYSLDPKPGSTLVDAPDGTVTTFSDVPVLTHASRPSVTEFFTRYSSLGCVVNGIQVRSFIHADCMKRVLTGTASDQNADFGAIAAFEHARDLPVPYLVLGSSAKSGPLASITGRAGTTNQIASLLAPPEYAAYDPFSPNQGYRPEQSEYTLVNRYLEASAERLRAVRGRGESNQRQIDAFVRSIGRQELLRTFAASQSGLGSRTYTPDLSVQTTVAVAALEGGLSHSVQLEFGDFDTHQDNSVQSNLQERLFAGLLGLNEALEERGLLERTLVVVMSEMGRTPKRNDTGGKDHWPITSMLVYGPDVASGRVLGQSDEAMSAVSVDLATGSPSSGGNQLQTQNLVAGILKVAGVDPGTHFPGVETFDALLA